MDKSKEESKLMILNSFLRKGTDLHMQNLNLIGITCDSSDHAFSGYCDLDPEMDEIMRNIDLKNLIADLSFTRN